jgi:hypothetical protein
MDNDFATIVVSTLAIIMALGLAVGAVLVIRDTVRKRGRWGINLRPVRCPECDCPAPTVRVPKNLQQTLWGGCTCEECGTEFDKWGQPVGAAGRNQDERDAADDGGA